MRVRPNEKHIRVRANRGKKWEKTTTSATTAKKKKTIIENYFNHVILYAIFHATIMICYMFLFAAERKLSSFRPLFFPPRYDTTIRIRVAGIAPMLKVDIFLYTKLLFT